MEHVFEEWAQMRRVSAVSPLQDASIQNYRFIWQSWVNFLEAMALQWNQAKSNHVRSFLQAIKPNSINHLSPSSVSQKRYARILREIYAFAVIKEWIEANPVTPSALISFTEDHESMVFPVKTWEKIKKLPAYTAEQAVSLPPDIVRNNAILHMLIFDALQVSEILDLLGQDCLVDQNNQVKRLAIRGSRLAQNRIVILQEASSLALSQWLILRSSKVDASGFFKPLFISRKQQGKLTAKSVFFIAREYLDSILSQDENLDRRSPGVLRNTRISEWLQTEKPEIVARKAGLQHVGSLSRLLPSEVQATSQQK